VRLHCGYSLSMNNIASMVVTVELSCETGLWTAIGHGPNGERVALATRCDRERARKAGEAAASVMTFPVRLS
jgi:hypothetical protein